MQYNFTSERDVLAAAAKIMESRAKRYSTVIDSAGLAKRIVRAFLESLLCDEHREHFVVLFLSTKHSLIKKEVLFSGTIDASSVWPREVVKKALELNAKSIIIAHNHPSGDLEPSSADISITRRIREALDLIDVDLLDHIIIGAGQSMSFKERGLTY